MTKEERKTVAEMLGEFSREAAVLVFVFLFFQRLLDEQPLSNGAMALTVISTIGFLVLGIITERVRKI